MSSFIEIKDLHFSYVNDLEEPPVKTEVLKGINLNIEKGEFVAVLGHNGSGKSTFAKHINALLLPTEGTIWIDGIDTAKEPELWKIRQKAGAQGHNLRISYGHKRFAWTKRRRQDHHNELHIGRDKKVGRQRDP